MEVPWLQPHDRQVSTYRTTTVVPMDARWVRWTCRGVRPREFLMTGRSGGTANHAKKAMKKEDQARWNATVCTRPHAQSSNRSALSDSVYSVCPSPSFSSTSPSAAAIPSAAGTSISMARWGGSGTGASASGGIADALLLQASPPSDAAPGAAAATTTATKGGKGDGSTPSVPPAPPWCWVHMDGRRIPPTPSSSRPIPAAPRLFVGWIG